MKKMPEEVLQSDAEIYGYDCKIPEQLIDVFDLASTRVTHSVIELLHYF